jgi:hypothetical protein
VERCHGLNTAIEAEADDLTPEIGEKLKDSQSDFKVDQISGKIAMSSKIDDDVPFTWEFLPKLKSARSFSEDVVQMSLCDPLASSLGIIVSF